jgi:hypothetical protein
MQPNPATSPADLKASRERAVFARFPLAARPDIDLGTIESRDTPEPDIACATFAGEGLAFELAEFCSPEIAKAVGDDLKRGGGVTFMWTADPIPRVLLKKLGKCYASAGPVDLLCYADGYFLTPDDAALDEMRATLNDKGLGPFRSVWFHGETGLYCVA